MKSLSDQIYNPHRRCTDKCSLLLCIGFFIALVSSFPVISQFPFCITGYVLENGDINRIIKGHDDCGNICGMKNDDNFIDFCGHNDKRSSPFTLINITNSLDYDLIHHHDASLLKIDSKCVANCNFVGYKVIGNRCISIRSKEFSPAKLSTFLQKITQDLMLTWRQILITNFAALILSLILLVAFRYFIRYIICIILILVNTTLALMSILCFAIYFLNPTPLRTLTASQTSSDIRILILGAIFGALSMILLLVVCCYRERIRLVVQLFKEASKALAGIPCLMSMPLLTFIALGITSVCFLFLAFTIESSGKIYYDFAVHKVSFEKDIILLAARLINIVGFLWFSSFIICCQHFVTTGTVCQWFFSRNRSKLGSPLMQSFGFLLRYHIGSVCLASMLMTIIKIIRMIIDNVKKTLKHSNPIMRFVVCSCCCTYVMGWLEDFIKYILRNALIVVAMDGTPLITSGKKAVKLLGANLIGVNAGDFVMFLGRVFVASVSGFVCYELIKTIDGVHYRLVLIILCMISAFSIVHCFLTVFEMSVDSIIICACEDFAINNGINRPYFMSRGLTLVMTELKGNVIDGQNV